jgi:hypothetical protein
MSTPFPTGETLTVTSTDAGLGSITISTPPQPVGYWVMPGGTANWYTKFSVYKKPRWHVRKMMLWVFGWDWEDVKSA